MQGNSCRDAQVSKSPATAGSCEPTVGTPLPSTELAAAYSSTLGQDSGCTLNDTEPVTPSGTLTRQSRAQDGCHNSASDNSCDSAESSSPSKQRNAELRRLCQSQEDLSIESPLPEAWSLPLYNQFVVPSRESDKMAAPAKRITDDGLLSPSVKRSRASSGEGWPHDPQMQRHIFRGGLQYHGPSTYRMGCEERDKDSNLDSLTTELLACHPMDSTPDIVFSPRGSKPASGVPQKQQNGWKTPSHAAAIAQSESLPPESPGPSTSDVQQSPQDNSPDMVVRYNNKLGPPPRFTQCSRGPPRRPPSHVPSSPGSWRCQDDSNTNLSVRSNEGANTWQDRFLAKVALHHQNDWKPTSSGACPPSEMELTTSPISRTFETAIRRGDATPPFQQRPQSSRRTTELPSPETGTLAVSHCQKGRDTTPDTVLRSNDGIVLPPRMMATQRRPSPLAPASQRTTECPSPETVSAGSRGREGSDGNAPDAAPWRSNSAVLPPRMTAAQRRHSSWVPSTSSHQQEGIDDDNAPDTVTRYNRIGPPPLMMAQRRHSSWAPRSSCLVEIPFIPSLDLSVATPSAKNWPYSLSNKDLANGAGVLDTHCHLDFIFRKLGHQGTFAKFRLEHRETFPDCYEGCIANFCNPAKFKECSEKNELLDEDGVWGAYGCHPHMAWEYNEQVEEYLLRALDHRSVVALGEIGLDYSLKNTCDHNIQQRVFRRQLELALNRRLPLVIHSRDATADTIRIMQELVPEDYPIHRHCFTGGWREAQQWLATFPNLCLGLTPLVAFDHVNRQPLTEAARKIPLDRLLLETDSPYFLPKWEMGRLKQSHPGMVIHVATRLSNLRNIPLERVLAVTRDNARRIYGI